MGLRGLLLIFLAFLTIQCSKETRKPSEIELLLSKRYQADKVLLTHSQVKNTTEGVTVNEDYILVELFDPKVLLDIKFNERIFKNKCDELGNYLLDSVKFQPDIDYNELRLKIIEVHGFFIFKSEEPTIISYKHR